MDTIDIYAVTQLKGTERVFVNIDLHETIAPIAQITDLRARRIQYVATIMSERISEGISAKPLN